MLKENKLQAYAILKILKYCTGSSARSYQCKFAVQRVLGNKRIDSMEELGVAIKQIMQFNTIRGKFSSVHPDLAAEGITRQAMTSTRYSTCTRDFFYYSYPTRKIYYSTE